MRIALTAAIVAAATSVVSAQGPPPDVEALGPQVGETVPAFSLPDQTGADRDLASLAGANGLMLVFSRSADW